MLPPCGYPVGVGEAVGPPLHKTNRSPPYPYCREHSEALPALGSEKRVHGALLKRRQVRLPRTTRAVAGKPLCQGKKSSAKARGHSECPWLGREPGFDWREVQHE